MSKGTPLVEGSPVSSAAAARRRHALMGARTRRLARHRVESQREEFIRCLVCEVGDSLVAIPLSRVAHISPFKPPALTPGRDPAFLGVLAYAGVFHHVFDLARLAGSSGGQDTADKPAGHIVLLRGQGAPTALKVDRALHVADLAPLTAAESAGISSSNPVISGFLRPLRTDYSDGRTIGRIDADQIMSASADSPQGRLA